MDMSWWGLRRRLLRRGATGEGHLEADLCWSVACMGRGGVSSIGRFGIATGVADVSWGGAECLDTPRSRRGVLRYWSSARAVESVLRSPLGEMFSRRRRFAVLTASSARPLLCGL